MSRKSDDIVLEGSNPSAEEPSEDCGGDGSSESGVDVVLNNRLVETSFTKKDYMNYLKTYTKA